MASFCIAVPGGGTVNATQPIFAEIIAPTRKPVFIRRLDFFRDVAALIPNVHCTLSSSVGTPVTATGPWDQGLNIDPDDPVQYSQTKVLRAWFTPPNYSQTLNQGLHKLLFPFCSFWPRGGIALQKNTSLVLYSANGAAAGGPAPLNIEFDE